MNPDRDISKLEEPFQSNVKQWLDECNNYKLDIFVTEAVRTLETQKILFGYGRTKEELRNTFVPESYSNLHEPVVTWTLNSLHIKGLAVDIAFRGNDLYPADINKWKDVASLAKRYSIDWGYDLWGKDKPHFQHSKAKTPDIKTRLFLNYKTMTESQKQLIEQIIYSFKACYNFGTAEMKDLVEIQVKNWKELLSENK